MIVAALPVSVVPEIELRGGRIYEVTSKNWEGTTYHFVGHNATEGYGRCSSAIQEFDLEKRMGVTRSGRVYKLSEGRVSMGELADADYVWQVWKQHCNITSCVDVTDQFIKETDE